MPDDKYVTLCNARDELDAQLIISVLKDSGIIAYYNDEYRQNIAGLGVPLNELTNQILVPESQLEEAKEILAELQNKPLKPNEDSHTEIPPKPIDDNRRPSYATFFVGGVLVGIIIAAIGIVPAYRAVEKYYSTQGTYEYDRNKDGKTDEWIKYYSSGRASEYMSDDNNDGKGDTRYFYNEDGYTTKMEVDADFNGSFNDITYYDNGLAVRGETDINNDGKPDCWRKYQNGMIIETDRDTNFDGKIDKKSFWQGGVIIRKESDDDINGSFETTIYYQNDLVVKAESDINNDGKPDNWTKYQNGKGVETDWDTNFDGSIDKWSFYKDGSLIRNEWNTDGDGKPDKISKYDRFENEIK